MCILCENNDWIRPFTSQPFPPYISIVGRPLHVALEDDLVAEEACDMPHLPSIAVTEVSDTFFGLTEGRVSLREVSAQRSVSRTSNLTDRSWKYHSMPFAVQFRGKLVFCLIRYPMRPVCR